MLETVGRNIWFHNKGLTFQSPDTLWFYSQNVVVGLSGQLLSRNCLKIQSYGWIQLPLTFIPVPKVHDFIIPFFNFIILNCYDTKLDSSELKF